jgi:hypothetical protein
MLSFIIVFIIVLWVYIIIYRETVSTNDLELYELNGIISKDKLEEICEYKHCFKFNIPDNIKDELNEQDVTNNIQINGGFDVNITETRKKLNSNEEKYLPLRLNEAIELIKKDNKYIIENNAEFLKETGNEEKIKSVDMYLRPPLTLTKEYDDIIIPNNGSSILTYNKSKRNYLYVSSGECDIILIPYRYSKLLNEEVDLITKKPFSYLNPWDKDKMTSEERNNFDCLKSLKITIKEGETIYIPSYWWYTIKSNNISNIKQFKYDVLSTYLSRIGTETVKMMQNTNINHKVYS